jgi:nucleotide-binding universal stress UspA family protein
MSIKNILWASDGSEESLDALKWVEVFATGYDANVIALSVFATANLNPAAVADDLRREIDLIDSEIMEKETKRLAEIRNALERKGIKAETHVARGVPHQEIIKTAHDRPIDLIAMGKRGLTPWEHDHRRASRGAYAGSDCSTCDRKDGCKENPLSNSVFSGGKHRTCMGVRIRAKVWRCAASP